MRTIAVVGLGYVGLPLAVAFGEVAPITGFDISEQRIAELIQGHDATGEVSTQRLQQAQIEFTTDPAFVGDCDFIIVAVPTPVNEAKTPNLQPLISASETVGKHLQRGAIIVYESTVYPGTTEEVCVPILERASGLQAGVDFFVGYSPERINPGDREHVLQDIPKVISGQTQETLDVIAQVYGQVVRKPLHRAPSIRVAEAAKVIENTQRDLNIALMNELSVIFSRLGIDTGDVLAAAGTKWNFIPFHPGLVGGHCIGVDPYYLTYKAQQVGYQPEVILAGRRINDSMGRFVATSVVKQMILRNVVVQGSTVTVLGLTFKQDVPDLRNSRVIDVIRELEEFGIHVQVTDPLADPAAAKREYGVTLVPFDELEPADALVLAVAHRTYRDGGWQGIRAKLRDQAIVADLMSALPRDECPQDVQLWRL